MGRIAVIYRSFGSVHRALVDNPFEALSRIEEIVARSEKLTGHPGMVTEQTTMVWNGDRVAFPVGTLGHLFVDEVRDWAEPIEQRVRCLAVA